MSKLYTYTGDDGSTSLIGGARVAKTDIRIVAPGDLDELNAHVGLLVAYVNESDTHSYANIVPQLHDIQTLLFHASTRLSALSANRADHIADESCAVGPQDIRRIEQWIDEMQLEVPQPHTFILPGGCRAAAQCHVCRVVTRRAERTIVAMAAQMSVDADVMRLVNRLSDFFFVLALKLNFISQVEEKKIYISCK